MKKNEDAEHSVNEFRILKLLLIMKLSFFLLAINVFAISAASFGQGTKLSIEMKNATVKEVLNEIEKQTDLSFIYKSDLINPNKKVSVSASHATVEEVLAALFPDEKINAEILDNSLIVLVADRQNNQQQKRISGTITDSSTGETLPGVNVHLEGTTIGAISDVDGKYILQVPDQRGVLVFSFVGYLSQSVPYSGQDVVDARLAPDQQNLDEVVVIGYGTKTKSTVTGSISTISSDEIKNSAVTTVAAALQGRVSGLYVTPSSGQPGAASNVYLRGPISISGGRPLYVVDGTPIEDLSYNFNMADIESINVLKDASAAAIYGAKAANGVILITTKRGVKSKAVVNFSGLYGVRNVVNMPETFKRDDYIAAKELFGYNVVDLFGPESGWSSLPDTDWLNEWYNPGSEQDYTLSMSGGGDVSTFYISGNYNRIEGNFIDNWINRYTVRINSDHQVTKKIKFTESAFVVSGEENPPGTPGNGFLTFRHIPVMAVYDPTNLAGGWGKTPKGFQGSNNVARALTDMTRFKNTVVYLTGSLNYEIIKGLNLNGSLGTTLSYQDGYYYQYPYDDGAFAMLEDFTNSNSKKQQYIATYTLNYTKEFNDHSLSGLLGYEARRSESRYVIYRNRDSFVSEPQSSTLAGGIANLTADFQNTDALDRILSQFARVEYGYQGKYLLTANIRRDGYGSKFGPENRYGIFPGMSAGWVISKESFMSNVKFMNMLKLRAGYGILGNAVGQDFAFTRYYESGVTYDWRSDGTSSRATALSQASKLPNPNIQWESVATTNIGFDAGFWENRVVLNVDLYSRQTNKMLYDVMLPPSAGVGTSVPANIGQMSNKGAEFNIEYRDEGGALNYFVAFNGGFNKNELISLNPDLERLYITSGNIGQGESGQGFYGLVYPCRSEPGQPLGQFYGFQTAGIWATDPATGETRPTYSGYTPKAGDLIYVDQNTDGKIDTKDMTYIGNPWPKFTYGITLGASWKNIELRALFNGVLGNDIYNAFESWEYVFFSDYNTTSKIYETSFFGDNGLTSVPRAGTLTNPDRNKNWGAVSDYHVQSGSYLRMKNLQLSYTLPAKALNFMHINTMKVFASADNLFVITKYKGMDPEIPAQGGSILAQGLDFTSQRYPLSRIVSMGINVTF